ncbi:MAG: catalase [Acetobacteraceae bacterium]|nr:catalase [Acetobacteraceae bacterium]
MAKTKANGANGAKSSGAPAPSTTVGNGGEWHQQATDNALTTNQGLPISDNQNSLRAGARGPTLLEDFILREKITHFDHERIPERIVHARGTGVHGFFELTESLAQYTTAKVLTDVGEQTPVFTRISTVAGGSGSVDPPRDVRGFAVKLYTKEGNWDLVGNNIPVFFIQDAIKFPDLVHAIKMEPDRGFPQAATAHDTFWDFISLTPESLHMIMWAMSDRTIPRSLRTIEGFGVHTFRLVNAKGESTFVKFHWRPKLGLQSTIWDEAVKIAGADPDFHRRDLYNAIDAGDFPEWALGVQLFSEDEAANFDFDHLDPTKLIPEEIVPLRIIGRMVLDRNPANVFDETEQVAFCTQNLVPGIDFSDDPLLHGRNFSYLDTQLSRLGSTNFNQIPINAPKCPFANMQRDGHMQTMVHPQRVTYTPSLLDPSGPRESPTKGFQSFPTPMDGAKQRDRSPTFADHYSQARQFFISQTVPEQDHIVAALIFELSKVETPIVREAMLGHLATVDAELGERVAAGLGFRGEIKLAVPAVATRTDLDAAPSLSMLARDEPQLNGRKLGVLVTDGASAIVLENLVNSFQAIGVTVQIICPTIGGVVLDNETFLVADHQLAGAPPVLFDLVAVNSSADGAAMLLGEAAAIAWIHDAFSHLKAIGYVPHAQPLLDAAGVLPDQGVVSLSDAVDDFISAANEGRIWAREPKVRLVY